MSTNPFKEGTHFIILNQSASPEPTIDYFFSVSHPHCYRFLPTFKAIRQQLPDGVRVKNNHVSFVGGALAKSISQAYATMCVLGLEDKVTTAMFDRLVKENRPFKDPTEIRQTCLGLGVDPDSYDSNYSSFSVKSVATQFDRSCEKYGIRGIPAMIINGKYQVIIEALSTPDDIIAVVNYLLTQH